MTAVKSFTTGTAPGAKPIVGHGLHIKNQPLEFLRSLHAYGDLVEVKLGPQRVFVVCHPDLLHHVLRDDRTFDKGGPFYDRARALLGHSLGNVQHDQHRRQRRLLQPAFQHSQLAQYGSAIETEVAELTGSWQPGQVVETFPMFEGLCLRILARTLFSTQVDEATVVAIQQATQDVLKALVRLFTTPQLLLNLPTPGNRRYKRAHAFLNSEVDRLIAECRGTGADHGDLLSLLITARESETGTSLDDLEIRDQVINLLLAGSQNPAGALTWALYRMTQHPDARAQLYEEVDTVLGGRPARWDDLPKLPRTSRFLTETLRFYPPVSMVTRITTQPTELAGTSLPAGATIMFSPPAVHHHGDVYQRPLDFDPDRWIPGQSATPPRTAFTAFGEGARKCIADNYSMNETVLILATIASRWEPRCEPGTDARAVATQGALQPRSLPIRLDPR
jgi:pentalenene oxygenase